MICYFHFYCWEGGHAKGARAIQEKREIGTSSSHDPCAGKECSGGLNLETGYEDHDDKSVEILDDLCPRKSRDKPIFFRLSKNLSFSDYQPVEGIGNSEHHIVNETEVLEANLHCDDNASLNGKESPGCREVDPQSGIDAEVTAVTEDHGVSC
ncbi:hypothetical protein C1H46_031229 [Malus baccata]|uniref:Uncharacterized protein n=1 Tax=Malus baccata TaxID=106549 RepID=A0A540L9S0_MALBA|nr:hypothetical protein C1H46_031229 [Malus baccata]